MRGALLLAGLLTGCAAPVVQPVKPPPPVQCNCVAYAIAALKTVGIRLRVIPWIGVNDYTKHKGFFSSHVVGIRDINDCRTMIHEFVHEWQYERDAGDSLDAHENWRREMQAAKITMYAELEMGRCKP